MKLATLASAALLLAAPLALAQTSVWKSDPMHSEVDFTVRHMSITNVRGQLGAVNATIDYNSQDVSKSTVQATINVSAINTGVAPRDNDLKSAKFFDVAKYPNATFVSTKVTRSGSGLLVDGNLTIKGITKPVVLHVDGPTATVIGMDKKTHEGFSATTTLDRREFDLEPSLPNTIVSDQVELTIDLDVAKQ